MVIAAERGMNILSDLKDFHLKNSQAIIWPLLLAYMAFTTGLSGLYYWLIWPTTSQVRSKSLESGHTLILEGCWSAS
jgi:hypothetical protein